MSKLIILRHGESEWNKLNLFTGWEDVSLTDQGKIEAKLAAFAIQNLKVDVNHAYTSALKRAKDTLGIVLYILKKDIPMISDQALNERNYGSLTGMNKDEARNKWGDEQVKLWRRSYDIAPENGESLKDTCERTIPYFKKNILPKLYDGENVIITAHGNSLRSIIMYVEELSEEEIISVEITTGIPIVYEYENKNIIKKTELFVKRY
ncbi:MAG: 2,3-bisphosphoglycerate-dependent phosphoglycerate mutase [Hyphomicrobiales bacterium]|nr:2,3-bisphosphoglycerate-dependent phosphoglycerate mutase [Rhodobiaceae bacterium]OUT82267.1 MAG: 2,3-bisphosphoglycerate-dependent phosphoglycerate mutase [Rhizobiales bacterium TMED28]RZO33747.1 MAG: 2,3-bisphosphoglycerate-dependent phosphoglycerate mutase [Hyphomicrobiales bacterium]